MSTFCVYPLAITLVRTDADPTMPTWLTNQTGTATPQVQVKTGNAADAGTYNFRITATVTGSNPLVTATYDFVLILC